jgi:hypothetical protein
MNVPSSTSSFEPMERTPHLPWGPVWTVAVIATLLLAGAAEAFWRWRGFEPSVVDNESFWAFHRTLLDWSERPNVVLLGKSRTRYGFATERFRERFPQYALSQLAIGGQDCVATFRDLASDETFNGVAICEITPYRMQPEYWNAGEEYIHKYKTMGPGDLVETGLAGYAESKLTIVYPELNLKRTVSDMARTRKFPKPPYYTLRFDRSLISDFDRADTTFLRQSAIDTQLKRLAVAPPLPPEEWAKAIAPLRKDVEAIQNRGGKVAIIHYPKGGGLYELEKRDFPRELYWDRLSEILGCPTVHFEDLPELKGIPTPDNSHIDHRWRVRFTDAITNELVKKGVLSPPTGDPSSEPQPNPKSN